MNEFITLIKRREPLTEEEMNFVLDIYEDYLYFENKEFVEREYGDAVIKLFEKKDIRTFNILSTLDENTDVMIHFTILYLNVKYNFFYLFLSKIQDK